MTNAVKQLWTGRRRYFACALARALLDLDYTEASALVASMRGREDAREVPDIPMVQLRRWMQLVGSQSLVGQDIDEVVADLVLRERNAERHSA